MNVFSFGAPPAEYLIPKAGVDQRCSFILTSYKRAHLLRWGLASLAQQKPGFTFEVIVLNDGVPDQTESVCRKFSDRMDVRYIFTGQRNVGAKEKWRIPGFALNIGVKQAKYENIVLSCAEMYHVDATSIAQLVNPLTHDPKLLTVCAGKDDENKAYLVSLQGHGKGGDRLWKRAAPLRVYFPFVMGMRKEEYISIGGYDEDFTGVSYDDYDFVQRLLLNGCRHVQVPSRVVHLWHPRLYGKAGIAEARRKNLRLCKKRRGIIKRNVSRQWGQLSD